MWQVISEMLGPLGVAVVIVLLILISGIKIIREYQRAVVFRLGRLVAARGPGIIYVIPAHSDDGRPAAGRDHAR